MATAVANRSPGEIMPVSSKPASKEGSKPASKPGSKPASKEPSRPSSKAGSKQASKEPSKKENEEEESKDKDTKKEAAGDKEKDDVKKEKSKVESTVGGSDEKKKRPRVRREDRIDKSMALYMARAERGAKKGRALRKNYFQALDQYQTTVMGGGTTVGGATAINEREDEDFAEKTVQEMKRFLVDEKLVETKIEFGGKWKFFQIFRRDPLKSAMDEYWRLEEAIGEDMMNVLSKTENIDGTKGMRAKDFTPGKPPPLKKVDDPAYELPWM